MKYRHYIIKRNIEDVFLYPFIIIGKIIARLNPSKNEFETFFFFPFYHTGGAEKVHALITQATGGKRSIIYFTRKSQDKTFYDDFVKSGCTIKDISTFTDNKAFYFLNLIYRGYIAAYINSQTNKPLVFNGQCNFAYKISPWVKRKIPQVELIHSFNTFSWIRIPFLPFISKTVMISKVRMEDHLKQYKRLKVPKSYASKIQYIVNGISLPEVVKEKDYTGTIKLLYVGRGTEEKRVHIVAKIAEQAFIKGLPLQFLFMGDVQEAIPEKLRQYCTFLGHKSDEFEIDEIYQQSHLVIITSNTEGFPMAIEEGMARGCAIMATPVGDIPVHVKNNKNGVLFSTVNDEAAIITEAINFLTLLCSDRKLLKEMADRNINYANKHFSIQAFNKSYRDLFNELRSKNY